MRRTAYSIAMVFGSVCCSAIALKFSTVPFLWMGVSWCVAGLVITALAPRALKLPIVIAAYSTFAFGLAELMLPLVVYRTTLPSPFREDALLGWSLRPSQVSRATARVGGEFIYDVAYSTDPDGFRVSPPDRGDQVEGCLFFFSDSFTFGEGVSDVQAFPYQVGLQTNGRFRVVNLSVPGYGAEQMLAAVEHGTLATNPPCEPTHIFYVALPHHVLRAAHKTLFSVSGPRYRMGSNGIPEYTGTNPRLSADSMELGSWRGWLELVKSQLRKSRICRALKDHKDRPPQTTEADITLYFALVVKAFRLFEHRWPKAELHVISWDIHDSFSNGQARFHKGLEAIPAQVHFIDDVLPGYTQDATKYGIHPRDLHPNPLAHELVATYLGQRVLLPSRSANLGEKLGLVRDNQAGSSYCLSEECSRLNALLPQVDVPLRHVQERLGPMWPSI